MGYTIILHDHSTPGSQIQAALILCQPATETTGHHLNSSQTQCPVFQEEHALHLWSEGSMTRSVFSFSFSPLFATSFITCKKRKQKRTSMDFSTVSYWANYKNMLVTQLAPQYSNQFKLTAPSVSTITNSAHPPKPILQLVQANNYRQLHPPEHVRTNPIVQLGPHLEFSMFQLQFPIPSTTDTSKNCLQASIQDGSPKTMAQHVWNALFDSMKVLELTTTLYRHLKTRLFKLTSGHQHHYLNTSKYFIFLTNMMATAPNSILLFISMH